MSTRIDTNMPPWFVQKSLRLAQNRLRTDPR